MTHRLHAPHAPRPRRPPLRRQGPAVTLVLLMLVVLDLFTLAPGYQYQQGGSRVANVLGSLRSPQMRSGVPPTPTPHAYVAWFADTDQVRVVEREASKDASNFFDVYCSFVSEYTGWWGLTTERRGFSWMYDSTGKVAGPPDVNARVNAVFVEHIRAQGDPFWIADAARATHVAGTVGYWETRVRWQGWARNAATIALWLCLLVALGLVWCHARERRRWQRLARGVCPDCRYDLGTLPRDQPCPECGMAHPPRDVAQVCRPSRAARVWRRARCPLGTLVFAALLVLDALLLPKGNKERRTGSWVANHLPTPVIRRDMGDGRPEDRLHFAVVMDNGRLVFQSLGKDWPRKNQETGVSAEEATIQVAGERRRVLDAATIVDIQRDSHTSGFWAPVRLYVYCNYGGWAWEKLPEDVRSHFVEHMIAWFESIGRHDWAGDARQREKLFGSLDTTLWSGHAHNAAAMGAALALLCSLTWIPDRLARRRARAHAAGADRCPMCLAPWAARDHCPVCGEPACRAA